MKKEIEITFKDLRSTLKENLIIGAYVNGEKVDEFTLQKDKVFIGADILVCSILGIRKILSLEEYLEIKEIKALYDEHFKKEVDLFEFAVVGAEYFFINSYGGIEKKRVENCDWDHNHKKHFNRFPTKELAEKARPMSLDERKQLLFANAKGYEVLTREELDYFNCQDVFELFYNIESKRYSYVFTGINTSANIYFKTEEAADECAYWMNETKEDK